MSVDLRREVVEALAEESVELDVLVADLDDAGWSADTPAAGWTVAHQIAHLTWTDEVALLAITDPEAFGEVLRHAAQSPDGFVDDGADMVAQGGLIGGPHRLLTRWRASRSTLQERLGEVPDGTRIAWFGPPMSAASMATARLMETWAHGLDIADALGVARTPTHRLRHVAHLGVRTRDYAYLARELDPPAAPFRVELTAPDGSMWTWGPEDASQRVTGPALDFCLLVTQRRHRDDLALQVTGPDAEQWLDIAQAFAGPPGPGRQPATGREAAS